MKSTDVIRDGEIVYQNSPPGDQVEFQFAEGESVTAQHYYYVRVSQQNGMMAWGSPVWVDYRERR